MRIYYSNIRDFKTGEWLSKPLVTRDNNMMMAFMRCYWHRYNKGPYTVTITREQGRKVLRAACPDGWMVMYFDGYEKAKGE